MAVASFRLEEGLWSSGAGWVAGVDEAGRGALAGPLVVGAVAAREPFDVPVADSKRLSPASRERAFKRLVELEARGSIAVATAKAEAWEVDGMGVARALRLAVLVALARLPGKTPGGLDALLVDGPVNLADWFPGPVILGKGLDGESALVAAASIVAKVSRDREMALLASRHEGYGWEANKGYGTPAHFEALRRLGPCRQHRLTFLEDVPDAGAATGEGGPTA